MIEIEPKYDHHRYEKAIYDFWSSKKLFHVEPDDSKEPFTILMPPPNVTSQLHMGHGTGYTLQDLLIRWKRMSGFNACWLPGTDHAGIATQMMVEQSIAKDGLSKNDLGREEFVNRLHQWKEKYGGIILEQFKKLGFSCDWSRLAYTMDPTLSKAVRHVFVKLYEEGLIYRGERLVNWDTKLQTAVSDDEVENKDINGFLYYFRYPLEDGNAEIPIATTRPETMLGDTGVAVNPEDERFKQYIGKKVKLPWSGRLVPIFGDDYVKSEFGTGAVKMTPAHDPNDFAIGKRHGLEFIAIMNDDGTLNNNVPEQFRGMDRLDAREAVIAGLKELGLFDEKKSYKHSVPHSERSKTIIEPKLSKQWFVKMDSLAKPAADAARSGELQFYPESWKKTYFYWLDNIQDWCISRQLWWGHRIPIWYCQDCQSVSTGVEDPSECNACGSNELLQDEDVLDTWFSSWLWPLSPFGWPSSGSGKNKDLEYFYPTDVLVTAPEILFLWVARMVMAGLKFNGQVPFKQVYFNATVCDKQGRKFSKTLGNGIDPLAVIEEYGADAVRYTATHLAPLGGRVRMEKSDFEVGSRFVNKIWNAARFLFRFLNDRDQHAGIKELSSSLDLPQKWIIHQLHLTAKEVDQLLRRYRINEAVETIHRFIWANFCDWAIEAGKKHLADPEETPEKRTSISVLSYAFEGALRLLHPIMPFVTEELWQKVPPHPDWSRGVSLAVSEFPAAEKIPQFPKESELWEKVQQVITGVRSARQQAKVEPARKLDLYLRIDSKYAQAVKDGEDFFKSQAVVNTLVLIDAKFEGCCLVSVGSGYEAYLPVEGIIDITKEKKRLEQELKRLEKVVVSLEKKLGSRNFVKRAPEEVILHTKSQHKNLCDQIAHLKVSLEGMEYGS